MAGVTEGGARGGRLLGPQLNPVRSDVWSGGRGSLWGHGQEAGAGGVPAVGVCLPRAPERAQGSQKPQHPQHAQDLGAAVGDHGHQDVDDGDEHQQPVQNVPAAAQVGLLPAAPAQRHHLRTPVRHRQSPALPSTCDPGSPPPPSARWLQTDADPTSPSLSSQPERLR